MPVIICDICSVAANKTMMVTVNLSYWHPRHTHYEPLVQYLPCWQQPSIKDKAYEVQVRVSYQLQGIYSICVIEVGANKEATEPRVPSD